MQKKTKESDTTAEKYQQTDEWRVAKTWWSCGEYLQQLRFRLQIAITLVPGPGLF